jgi:hypothetical protein
MLAHRMPGPDATVVALCNVTELAGDVRDLLVATVHATLTDSGHPARGRRPAPAGLEAAGVLRPRRGSMDEAR